MKLAIELIVIGGLLLIEGGSRITVGIMFGNALLAFGGVLTGVLLGGYLLYRGIRRLMKHKTSTE